MRITFLTFRSRPIKIISLLSVRAFINLPLYKFGYKFDNISKLIFPVPWWRHQMETFSALLAICAGNSPVHGEFPAQKPVTRSFDVFFDLHLNKRLSKQSWGWCFFGPKHAHCDVTVMPTWLFRCSQSISSSSVCFLQYSTRGVFFNYVKPSWYLHATLNGINMGWSDKYGMVLSGIKYG